MRKKKELEKKKDNSVEENEIAAQEKKVTSHPVMQMQSIFGNRAIERAIRKNERFFRERKRRSKRLSDSFETFDIIPIYRFPNSPQVGVRMYRTKEQFHYDHRLYIPKKIQDHSEENVQDQREETIQDQSEEIIQDQGKKHGGQIKKRTQIGSNFGLFHLDRNKEKEIEEKNSKAKEHFLKQNKQNDRNEKSDMSSEEMEEMIQKKIKWGRFSFLAAYPLLVKMIRKKKKEEQKERKNRKKSKISRLSSRFSNIT